MSLFKIIYILFLISALSCCTSFDYNDNILIVNPSFENFEIRNTEITTCQISANLKSDGGTEITETGVCWSEEIEPTIKNHYKKNYNNNTSFQLTIENLSPNNTYYIRAYAKNKNGYGYSPTISTRTLGEETAVSIDRISNIGLTTATLNGSISEIPNFSITQTGFCWSIYENPTIDNSEKAVSSNPSVGAISSNITNLSPGTTYYVRAFSYDNSEAIYGIQKSFKTEDSFTDIDGNSYKAIKIGDQVWMTENLKTSKYRDGTPIPYITTSASWSTATTGGYCDYLHTPANSTKYGKLYNWYSIIDSHDIAPEGWHIPSDEEWTQLENYLMAQGLSYDGSITNNGISKSLVTTTEWITSSVEGAPGNNPILNNSSGFNGLSAGKRYASGTFLYQGTEYAYWWSTTEQDAILSKGAAVGYDRNYLTHGNFEKTNGFSVRCIKD